MKKLFVLFKLRWGGQVKDDSRAARTVTFRSERHQALDHSWWICARKSPRAILYRRKSRGTISSSLLARHTSDPWARRVLFVSEQSLVKISLTVLNLEFSQASSLGLYTNKCYAHNLSEEDIQKQKKIKRYYVIIIWGGKKLLLFTVVTIFFIELHLLSWMSQSYSEAGRNGVIKWTSVKWSICRDVLAYSYRRARCQFEYQGLHNFYFKLRLTSRERDSEREKFTVHTYVNAFREWMDDSTNTSMMSYPNIVGYKQMKCETANPKGNYWDEFACSGTRTSLRCGKSRGR